MNPSQDSQHLTQLFYQALETYLEKQPDSLVAHCAFLDARAHLSIKLEKIGLSLKLGKIEQAVSQIKEVLHEERERTKKTALSFFSNPDLPENQLRIALAQLIAPVLNMPPIAVLCPDLALESFHDSYPSLNEIPLEEVFTQFIESEHQAYLVPVRILSEIEFTASETITLPYNYYYDYERQEETQAEAAYLTLGDIEKAFDHSVTTRKIQQSFHEYWDLEKDNPSLYTELMLFAKRLAQESVNERGSEFDTGAGAYQLIIDFFNDYNKLPESDKTQIPLAVRKQLDLIYEYSCNPEKNINSLGEQEVGTCTATRSKELTKALSDSNNKEILKNIARSTERAREQRDRLEKNIFELQQELLQKNYKGQYQYGGLLPVIEQEEWTLEEIFPDETGLSQLSELSPFEIKQLLSLPHGHFAHDFRESVAHSFNNPKLLDIALHMSAEQKVALCESLKDLIVNQWQERDKFSYLTHVIGAPQIEKALQTELLELIQQTKNAFFNSEREAPFSKKGWTQYCHLSDNLKQLSYSQELQQELNMPPEAFIAFLKQDDFNFYTLKKVTELPLPLATLDAIISWALAEPRICENAPSFDDIASLLAIEQVDDNLRKKWLSLFFATTESFSSIFYMGLGEKIYETILLKPELLATIAHKKDFLNGLKYSEHFQYWLQKERDNHHPMAHGLLPDFASCFTMLNVFDEEVCRKLLPHAPTQDWAPFSGTLQQAGLTHTRQLTTLLEYPNIANYFFSSQQLPYLIKETLEIEQGQHSKPVTDLLNSTRSMRFLTKIHSFQLLNQTLAQLSNSQSKRLWDLLLNTHLNFLKNIARTRAQEEKVFQLLKQSSLLYRAHLGFLDRILSQIFGPSRVIQWERHMHDSQRRRGQETDEKEEKSATTSQDDDLLNLGPSSKKMLVFSEKNRASQSEQHLKNK